MTRRSIVRRLRLAGGVLTSLTVLVALALGLGAIKILEVARRAEQ